MVKKRDSEKVVIQDESVKEGNVALMSLINDLEVGESVSYKNLYLFPVYRNTLKNTKLKTLTEALKEGIVKVDETGTVSQLKVTNISKDTKVLIMEGEIVKGGAQDRIINTSMILDENSSAEIPTTCVQQGRWDNFDAGFDTTSYASPKLSEDLKMSVSRNLLDGYATKGSSVGLSSYASDQGSAWNTVEHCLLASSVKSGTSNYNDIAKDRKKDIEEYKKAFEGKFPLNDKSIVGMVISVDNICRADICADHELFKVHYEGLLEGCIIDALNTKDQTDVRTLDDIISCLDHIMRVEYKVVDTPNKTGQNLIISDGEIQANALLYKGEIVHLTAYLK